MKRTTLDNVVSVSEKAEATKHLNVGIMYNNEILNNTCPHYTYPAVLNILMLVRMTDTWNNYLLLLGSMTGLWWRCSTYIYGEVHYNFQVLYTVLGHSNTWRVVCQLEERNVILKWFHNKPKNKIIHFKF
jgi:hypothetical protein